MAVAADMLTELGLTGGTSTSGSLTVTSSLVSWSRSEADVDVQDAIRAVDKRAKIDEEEYMELLTDAGLNYGQADNFDEMLHTDADELGTLAGSTGSDDVAAAVENLEAVLSAAEGLRRPRVLYGVTDDGARTGLLHRRRLRVLRLHRRGFPLRLRRRALRRPHRGASVARTPAVGFAPGHATSSCSASAPASGRRTLSTDYYLLQVGDTRSVAARIARDLRERKVTSSKRTSPTGASAPRWATPTPSTPRRSSSSASRTSKRRSHSQGYGKRRPDAAPVDEFPGDHERPTYDDVA